MRKEYRSHFHVILRKFFLFVGILTIFIVCTLFHRRNGNLNSINEAIPSSDFTSNTETDYSAQNFLTEIYSTSLAWQLGYPNLGIIPNAENCFSDPTIISFSSLVPISKSNELVKRNQFWYALDYT